MVAGFGNSFDFFEVENPLLSLSFGTGDLYNEMSLALNSCFDNPMFNNPMFDPTMMGGMNYNQMNWKFDPMTGQPINPNMGQVPNGVPIGNTGLTMQQEQKIKENTVSNMTNDDANLLRKITYYEKKQGDNEETLKSSVPDLLNKENLKVEGNKVSLKYKDINDNYKEKFVTTEVSDEYKNQVDALYKRLSSLTDDWLWGRNKNDAATMAITAFALGLLKPDELNAEKLDQLKDMNFNIFDKTENAKKPQELLYALGYFRDKYNDKFVEHLKRDKWGGTGYVGEDEFQKARGTLSQLLFDESNELYDAHQSAIKHAKEKEVNLKKQLSEKSAEIANLKDNSYLGEDGALKPDSTRILSIYAKKVSYPNLEKLNGDKLAEKIGMTQERKQHLDSLISIIFQGNPDKATIVDRLKHLCNVHASLSSVTAEAKALDNIYLCHKTSEQWNAQHPEESFWDEKTQTELGTILNKTAKSSLQKAKAPVA